MHEYDSTLKSVLTNLAGSVIVELTAFRVERWHKTELPSVRYRRADMLGETAQGNLGKIAASKPSDRATASAELMILAGLRKLGTIIEREMEQMPILDDIMDHDVLGPERRRGIALGGAEGLTSGASYCIKLASVSDLFPTGSSSASTRFPLRSFRLNVFVNSFPQPKTHAAPWAVVLTALLNDALLGTTLSVVPTVNQGENGIEITTAAENAPPSRPAHEARGIVPVNASNMQSLVQVADDNQRVLEAPPPQNRLLTNSYEQAHNANELFECRCGVILASHGILRS
jgi:hypothetical protein